MYRTPCSSITEQDSVTLPHDGWDRYGPKEVWQLLPVCLHIGTVRWKTSNMFGRSTDTADKTPSGSGSFKLAGFFGTWVFSKPAAKEFLLKIRKIRL